MKKYISIDLSDEQKTLDRTEISQNQAKKLITRSELNKIVQDYVQEILTKSFVEVSEKYTDGIMADEWTSLLSLKSYFERTDEETVVDFDGFSLTTDKYVYTLALGTLSKESNLMPKVKTTQTINHIKKGTSIGGT